VLLVVAIRSVMVC